MHNVTDEEIDFILDDITKRGIVTEDVRDNILDHVCCIIEHEMPDNGNFYEFYRNTIARFYQKELREIEEETRKLVTFKYYYAMKRTLKITGFITVLLVIIGSIFKVQHLPGAGALIVAGFSFFSLVFVPLNIVMKFRDDKEKYNRFIISFGLLLTLTGTFGMLMKVMHWPYANITFYSSLALFGLVYIPVYFITRYRNPETRFNAIVHTTFMIAAAGIIFAMIDTRKTNPVKESIVSLDEYQADNLKQIKVSNDYLYTSFQPGQEGVAEIRTLTTVLYNHIEAIKRNLIAKSNGVAESELTGTTLAEARYPNDGDVIRYYFENATGDLSYEALKSAMDEYNNGISALNQQNVVRPLITDRLKMTKTVLSVVLHELSDIQVQLLANENSYLCFRKGELAAR